MKKGGFLRNVLDTIRSNQTSGPAGRGQQSERALEFGGQLKPQHFSLCQVARHGFPEQPTALAFDPVQKIAAIGTKSGALRVFGRPGVDVCAQHEPAFAVTHIKFVVNQGAIITVTADESIHLWSLRGPGLRLQFSAGAQAGAGSSPQANSPAPTPASNLSSVSPQSGSSAAAAAAAVAAASASGRAGGDFASSAASPSSFLGQITDTVSGAVDSASDFLSGGGATEFQTTPSPTSDFRHSVSRKPEIIHTLKFQREHITCLHQTLTSKWLYIGTERGNVHVANVDTFELSGYSIAWNKAIELSRKTHPGAIIHLSECPQDTNKLLIGYESGCIVIWDLKQRTADGRYYHTDNLLWLAWHYEGKQFVAAHGDGSLITWQTRSNARPALILHPHAKTGPAGAGPDASGGGGGGQQQQQQQSLTVAFARSLNNELYRPINKVEWKVSKGTNEPFYLFSGGLPYDGLEQAPPAPSSGAQFLKASPQGLATPSPMSPVASISPGGRASGASNANNDLRQSQQQLQHKDKRSLRSTSLTVMYGKSITVLEMDDTIIDFITICDNSPYENDTSEPYAVIVLLSNELILIDLTSAGYPTFDSPYPSASLSESPVTCVHYLADCSSDLIPFLYSSSQNAISRAPKKGFSDKEWPINGGEWGQSMQSYPELVLTGHADGTIKFWDMSGVNFDLISKIKTSKLFERPSKPPNAVFVPSSASFNWPQTNACESAKRSPSRHEHSQQHQQQQQQHEQGSPQAQAHANQEPIEERLFAIEKIEFCSTTKRLLVASALGQVIQFRLNKRDHHHHSGSGAASVPASGVDLTTIMVEPSWGPESLSRPTSSGGPEQQAAAAAATGAIGASQWKPHRLFQVRASQAGSGGAGAGAGGSTSGGSSSSSGSHRTRGLSGFQAEIVCLTPLLTCVAPTNADESLSPCATSDASQAPARAVLCRIPPKITVLAFQATHNILAYAHESGIVLVDIIQKCVIINATLNDLYGGCLSNANDRDISIQPYATSSILQDHYQATSAPAPPFGAPGDVNDFRAPDSRAADNGTAGHHQQQQLRQHNRADSLDNERSDAVEPNRAAGGPDGVQSSAASPSHRAAPRPALPQVQSRYTNSMFQRQLSTNALNTNSGPSGSAQAQAQATAAPAGHGKPANPRLFQRQMTASQLFSGGSGCASGAASGAQDGGAGAGINNGKKRLLNAARADANLASSVTCLATNQSAAATAAAIQAAASVSGSRTRMGEGPGTESSSPAAAGKKPAKNKRIISRMLSISAIHTSVGGAGASAASAQESATQAGVHSAREQSHGNSGGLGNASCSGGGGGGGGIAGASSSSDTAHANNHTAAFGGADKFSESSFRRSRSSSTSSATGHGHSHLQQAAVAAAAAAADSRPNESILCLAFLDPALAAVSGAAAAGASADGAGALAAGSQTGAISSSSSQSSAAGPAAAGGQVQSSAGPNHKSLSSNDNSGSPSGQLALWLGTSSGTLLLLSLQMPDTEDNRILQLQSITAEPLPHASVKLNGQILCIAPFACEARLQQQQQHTTGAGQTSGASVASAAGAPGAAHSSSSGFQSVGSASSSLEGDPLLQSPSSSGSSGSATCGTGAGARRLDSPAGGSFDARSGLFLAVVSEKQARVYQVPAFSSVSGPAGASAHSEKAPAAGPAHSKQQPAELSGHHHQHQGQHQHQHQEHASLAALMTSKRNLIAECELSESSFACHAALVAMRASAGDETCLVCYLATGNLLALALPRLRPVLLDADFVPYSSARIAATMCLSRQGHGLYQPAPGELCKFTVSAHYKALVNDMLGLLHVPREMPEMPRTNFFKSLFSVSQNARQSDRDELFGEAGRASRGLAHHSSGAGVGAAGTAPQSGLDKLKGAAVGTMGHDMRLAREGLDERGEKLSEIEDRTLQMMNQSESYAQAAHQLAQKFKDKKWYQF